MKEIDKNSSRSIDRIEWLKHLCVEDEKTGKQVFRNEVRKLFVTFDKDNSGYLSGNELKKLIKTMFAKYLKNAKDEKTMFNLSMMINSLSNEIIDELDIDAEKNLSWGEFKYFIDKILEKQVKLSNFINEVF
jgi:Ca2+-binding EF-hand superfamily protein